MEATNLIAKSADFRRISDFDFGPKIKDIILSTTSDSAALILWCRRADYYNTIQLLTGPLGCSDEVARLILENMDRLHLIFHEKRPARFFRTVFAVVKNELPRICVSELYERQISISDKDLDLIYEFMTELLRPAEFESIKRYYGFDTNQPLYVVNNVSHSDFDTQNALRRLGVAKVLYGFYERSFTQPD